ncbi:MAG: hypothetical protein CL424_07255 [Acidimicrobiaceae bacterium]|nr:hypothetical protein [Acidimicrobiaceae bacterium]
MIWTEGIFGTVLSVSSWLFTAIVGLVALVVARGVIATSASRRLVPARREMVAAESRLAAHDATFGRTP